MAALGAGLVALSLVSACAALGWPADGFRAHGDEGLAWLLLGCAAAAFVAYAAGVWLVARRGASLRAVVAVALALQLVPLAAPLLLSTDAWTYWAYGRIAAVHGESPYGEAPAAFPSDPALPFAGPAWRDSTSVYGPAFTLASEPVALAAGGSADAAAWIYKGLAAAAVVVSVGLATALARRRAVAAAFAGWNPVLALHFAGGGHNDAWMAALVMGALALGAGGRRQLAGAAWAAAVLVKWVPLVLLPLRAVQARGRRRVGHLGFAAAAGVLVAVATWRYGAGWLGAFGPLARNAELRTRFAVPARLEQAGIPEWLALALVSAAFAAAYVWLLLEAARGRARLGLAAALLLLAVPYLAPWYLVWAVPLAAAEDDPSAQRLSLALSAYLLPQTVPV